MRGHHGPSSFAVFAIDKRFWADQGYLPRLNIPHVSAGRSYCYSGDVRNRSIHCAHHLFKGAFIILVEGLKRFTRLDR